LIQENCIKTNAIEKINITRKEVKTDLIEVSDCALVAWLSTQLNIKPTSISKFKTQKGSFRPIYHYKLAKEEFDNLEFSFINSPFDNFYIKKLFYTKMVITCNKIIKNNGVYDFGRVLYLYSFDYNEYNKEHKYRIPKNKGNDLNIDDFHKETDMAWITYIMEIAKIEPLYIEKENNKISFLFDNKEKIKIINALDAYKIKGFSEFYHSIIDYSDNTVKIMKNI